MVENLEPSKFLSVSQLLESHPLAGSPGAKIMSWLHPSCYTPNAKHFLESLLIELFHLLQRVWNKTKIQIATMQSHNLIWLQPHDQAALCSMLFILRVTYTIVLSPDSLPLERTTWLQQTLAVHSFPDARAWEWDQPLLRWFKKLQIVTEFITVAPHPTLLQ